MQLITSAQRQKLFDNGRAQRAAIDRQDQALDFEPVVKLFTPDGNATWLLTEFNPDYEGLAFGLCDLGLGEPELGYVSLTELAELRGPLGLPIKVENATFGRWYRTKSHAKLYLHQLERTSERFAEFDLVLYQAGADVHVDDPLGGVLDSEQMRHRDRIVFGAAKKASVPLAWDLAGGYQEPVSKVIKLHVATMEECVRAYARQ